MLRNTFNKFSKFLLGSLLFFFFSLSYASPYIELARLQDAYPETLQEVSSHYVVWKDGRRIPVTTSSAFMDNFLSERIYRSQNQKGISVRDLRCDKYEPFFKKMYGSTADEVKKNLVTIYWMPHVFGTRYPLKVTTVNDVDKKLQRISDKLEQLPPTYYKYLDNPAGTYYWRRVSHENYLSAHSFGIAIDINARYGSYWLWDRLKSGHPLRGLTYQNKIPMEIVEIFEQEGFLWGGRWAYYDTMHFEYRPELFKRTWRARLEYNHQLGLRCA